MATRTVSKLILTFVESGMKRRFSSFFFARTLFLDCRCFFYFFLVFFVWNGAVATVRTGWRRTSGWAASARRSTTFAAPDCRASSCPIRPPWASPSTPRRRPKAAADSAPVTPSSTVKHGLVLAPFSSDPLEFPGGDFGRDRRVPLVAIDRSDQTRIWLLFEFLVWSMFHHLRLLHLRG